MILNYIGTSLGIEMDDPSNLSFSNQGERMKTIQFFGVQLQQAILEMSEMLAG